MYLIKPSISEIEILLFLSSVDIIWSLPSHLAYLDLLAALFLLKFENLDTVSGGYSRVVPGCTFRVQEVDSSPSPS